MAIDRTNYNALVDDDGSGTTGTFWNKTQLKNVILDPVDAAILNPSSALTLAAGQIVFPATRNPSTNGYTLDDYRENLWFPTINGTGGQSGQTYSTQIGEYVKVGRVVVVSFYLVLSAKGTITGTVQLGGLPFPIGLQAGPLYWYPVRWLNLVTNWYAVNLSAAPGASVLDIVGLGAAGPNGLTAALTTADLGNTSAFAGCFAYPSSN